jgi:DNA segregation ATPase FtsK/SpoIIIE-like protein
MSESEHDPARRTSIDLSLELERQLDDEDEPISPRRSSSERPASLDPTVLASIVTQLRMNFNEATKERDELAAIVAGAHGREAELKDALQFANEKCKQLETELAEANQKIKDDEDNIKMLRSKVDESRLVRFYQPWDANAPKHLMFCLSDELYSINPRILQTRINAATVRTTSVVLNHGARYVSCRSPLIH